MFCVQTGAHRGAGRGRASNGVQRDNGGPIRAQASVTKAVHVLMHIWDCVLGFMDAQILLTAEKLGIFDTLAAPGGTAEDVAEAAGLPDASARRLLTALCALELVKKHSDGRFINAPETEEQLVRGRPGYIGHLFEHIREDLYPLWQHFDRALVEEKAQWERISGGAQPRNEEVFEDPERLHTFMKGMHAITYAAAQEFATEAPELAEVGHLVDVGGASGAFLIALAEAFPDLEGTVYDLPRVRSIAGDYIARHDLDERLCFHAGNFWEEPLPEGADAYALGFILHDWDTPSGSTILRKVADAIRPGGLLVIGEYLLTGDKTGPLHVARQDLNMLVAAHGRERSAREYAEWIEAFGFELERIQSTSHGRHFLIARQAAT